MAGQEIFVSNSTSDIGDYNVQDGALKRRADEHDGYNFQQGICQENVTELKSTPFSRPYGQNIQPTFKTPALLAMN